MIKIEIKKAKQIPGINNLFITMSPYNSDIVSVLKSYEDRQYNKDTKEWELPFEKLSSVIDKLHAFDINVYYTNMKKEHLCIPSSYAFKVKPFPHQLTGIEYGLSHNNWLLADDMGLGKSFQVINIGNILKGLDKVHQCLIVCGVNSIKLNWREECEKYSDNSVKILGERYRKNGKRYIGSVQDRIDDIKTSKEFFLITNIETFRSDDFIKALKKNTTIDMVVLDEAHRAIKNHTTAQGKNFLKVESPYKVAVTGTPVVNKPLDVFGVLKWLGVENANYSTFKKYYTVRADFGSDVVGYRNLDVLKSSLQNCMLRRLKEDVLPDLPDKIVSVEYVEMGEHQRLIYEEMKQEILQNIDLIRESHNPLSHLLRLRQATDHTSILTTKFSESAKLDRLVELVDDIVSSGHKCIVVSNWTTVTDILQETLKEYNPAIFTGEVNEIERNNEKIRFNTDPTCKICIGTIGAMGVSLTLTSANYCIFFDLPWTMTDFKQTHDRIHRIGQKDTVNVISLLCEDSIDERMYDLIQAKGQMADYMTGDGIANNMDTFNYLIS